MGLVRIKEKNADYIDRLYRELWRLQGTEVFEAYSDLFSILSPNPRAHYEIVSDQTNRRLMVAIHKNGRLGLESLASEVDLDVKAVKKRIDFFRANGMKRD